MPEMFQYCGRRITVVKRAHKSCDTVNRPAGLRLKNMVHLENLRCDGSAHGGCQAACLLFWRTEWLKPAGQVEAPVPASNGRADEGHGTLPPTGCTEADVRAATRAPIQPDPQDP